MPQEGPFYLIWDESDPAADHYEKIRRAPYASLDEAIAQAEHDLCTPTAVERMRKHMRLGKGVDVPMGLGRRVLRVEDAGGQTVWEVGADGS